MKCIRVQVSQLIYSGSVEEYLLSPPKGQNLPGPEFIKLFSCSTQLSI